MKLFSKFDTNQRLKSFSKEVVTEFEESFPPDENSNLKRSKLHKKYTKSIKRLQDQITEYRKNNSLGVYKKSKLIKLIVDEVANRGYSQEVFEDIKEKVLMCVTTG